MWTYKLILHHAQVNFMIQ